MSGNSERSAFIVINLNTHHYQDDEDFPRYNCSSQTISDNKLLNALNICINNIIDVTNPKQSSVFEEKEIPKISLFNYLTRIVKYCKLSKATIIMTLVYLDRLPEEFILTNFNVHK